MSGGGGQTSSSQNGPPAEYLAAYRDVLGKAQTQAATPYEAYPGNLQADFSPMQQQGFNVIGSAPGISAPYINQAAQNYTNATAPLAPTMQPYVDSAAGQYGLVAGSSMPDAIAPYIAQAATGFGNGSQALTPDQYSAGAIQSYYSPYQKSVIDATQAQFNQQNAQAQNQLRGNAASQGALGGDRLGVAQGVLAGQQQTAQAPVIAGLENQGFAQAQQEFNQQQQTGLTAQQQSRALQQQGALGFTGLGNQSLAAATAQNQARTQAAAGFAGLGQNELGAAQAQGWLNSQAGSGFAGLGNEALSSTLSSGNALMGAGGQQQAQAQQSLNIPYQQWLGQKGYPYQNIGWLSNIAQGLGSASGSTGSQTTPGPSAASQIGGLGVGIGGLAGSGAFKGLGSSIGDLFGSGASAAAQGLQIPFETGAYTAASSLADSFINRGGRIKGFAGGGGVPDVSLNGIPIGGDTPGAQDVTIGAGGVPDASANPIPGGGMAGAGTAGIKRDWGTTQKTEAGPHDSIFGTIAKGIGTAAATFYGGPAGFAAANTANQLIHFDRGGRARGFAGGGAPVLPRGFAAGGAPAINVTSVPNERGQGVPTMVVDPAVIGTGSTGFAGSPSGQLNDYLSAQKATAFKPPPPPAPAPAPAAAPNSLTDAQTAQLQAFLTNLGFAQDQLNNPGFAGGSASEGGSGGGESGGAGEARYGGRIRGFADGGDTGSTMLFRDDLGQGDPDDNYDIPVPAGFSVPSPARMRRGDLSSQHSLTPTSLVPDASSQGLFQRNPGLTQPLITPDRLRGFGRAVAGFPGQVYQNTLDENRRFNNQVYGDHETDLSDPIPAGLPRKPEPPRGRPDGSDPWAGRGSGATVPDDDRGFNAGDYLSPADKGLGDIAVAPDPSDSPVPATSAPAAKPAPSGGGKSAPAGTGPLPITDQPGNQAAAPPPPPRGMRSGDQYGDELRATRALQEDKANPWLALATAGFGAMAGTSPHALTNIGAGALEGIKQYVSSDRAAKELAAKVDENRVRLKETQAYREATTDWRNRNAATAESRAQTYAAQQTALATYRANKAANPTMSSAVLMDRTIKSLTGTTNADGEQVGGVTNPETGQIYTQSEAMLHLKGTDERARHNRVSEGQGQDRIEIARQRLMDTQEARDQMVELRRQGMSEANARSVMNDAVRLVTGDLTGKKTLQQALTEVRANQPTAAPAATPAAAPAAPAAIPSMPAGLPPGSQYSPSRKMWRDPSGKTYDANGAPQ